MKKNNEIKIRITTLFLLQMHTNTHTQTKDEKTNNLYMAEKMEKEKCKLFLYLSLYALFSLLNTLEIIENMFSEIQIFQYSIFLRPGTEGQPLKINALIYLENPHI